MRRLLLISCRPSHGGGFRTSPVISLPSWRDLTHRALSGTYRALQKARSIRQSNSSSLCRSSRPAHHTMPGLLDTKGFQFYSLKFAIAVTAEMIGVFVFAFYSSSAPSEYAAWANGLSLAVMGRDDLIVALCKSVRCQHPRCKVWRPCSVYNRQHQRRSSQPSRHSGHSVHWAHISPQSSSIHCCADCWCRSGSPDPGKLLNASLIASSVARALMSVV